LLAGGSVGQVLIGEMAESAAWDPYMWEPLIDHVLVVFGPGSEEAPLWERAVVRTQTGAYLSELERGTWVLSPSWSALTEALRFEGVGQASTVWANLGGEVVGSDRFLLRGLGAACRPVEEGDENGFVFVRLCPGRLRMGSEQGERLTFDDEFPSHLVTLSAFAIGKYEVTNREFHRFQPGHSGDDDLPVTDVSWFEADAFCRRFGHRLPTEAEWEFAARAGTTTLWSSGDDEADLERYAWYEKNSGGEAHSVGSREPNPWGIHDLHGNVWEWVADWYGPYSAEPQVDPTGPPGGTGRVLRGGSFASTPRVLRSAFRLRGGPGFRGGAFGFRCVRGPRRQP
jgi:formylglycine-generating enzyme required for sulfatase activity